MRRLITGVALALGLVTSGVWTAAVAQPSSPIRLIVAFAPGGGVDVVARLVADRLSNALKQTVVVENRPGAAGVIAARQVVSAEPDGRTILVASNPLLINQVLRPETNFPVLTELTPVASVTPQAIVIVAGADVPVKSLAELFDLARDRDVNYGTTGSGSLSHLAVEYLLAARPGSRMQHIPFQGSAPALTAVMSGQVEVGSSTVPPAVPLMDSGRLRALAVANEARSVMLPNVPTFAESGFPTLPVSAWVGFFVSSRTPTPLVEALSKAIIDVAAQPELAKKLLDMGFEPKSSDAGAFKSELSAELKLWTEVAGRLRMNPAK